MTAASNSPRDTGAMQAAKLIESRSGGAIVACIPAATAAP